MSEAAESDNELHERLTATAIAGGAVVTLRHTPFAGVSHQLLQLSEQLYLERRIMPLYLPVRTRQMRASAYGIAYGFMLQTAAFLANDRRLIDIAPPVSALIKIVPGEHRGWFTSAANDLRADDIGVASLLRFPRRAAAAGVPVLPIFDGLHNAEPELFSELVHAYADVACIIAVRRRFEPHISTSEVVTYDLPTHTAAAKYLGTAASAAGIAVSGRTIDLAIERLGRSPKMSELLIASAKKPGTRLETFADLETVITASLADGEMAAFFRSAAADAFPTANLDELLNFLAGRRAFSVAETAEAAGIDAATAARGVTRAVAAELLIDRGGHLGVNGEGLFGEYLDLRTATASRGRLAVIKAAASSIKAAPHRMEAFYRANAAIGIRPVLKKFDGQVVPRILFDSRSFTAEYKGAPDNEILRDIAGADDIAALPSVFETAFIGDIYEPFNELAAKETAAAAFGFTDAGEDVVWLAAEVPSKLEADRETAEFWCDRLEMAAVMADITRFRIWLIAPEGFDDAAAELLERRNAFGSSRKQFALLERLLSTDRAFEPTAATEEFEFIVPMDGDSEMVSAHVLEDIARRHNFTGKEINQVKTALVEACINAAEHSLSSDRRIHQKFRVEDGRLTVTVANRGLRLEDSRDERADDERRGWGLKLMRELMDDVTVERTEDGTTITMVKEHAAA